jgi:hypothetical protein
MCPVCSVNHVTSLYPYFSLPLRERVRVRGSKIWHPHLIPLRRETVSKCHPEAVAEGSRICKELQSLDSSPAAQNDIRMIFTLRHSLRGRGSLITSLPVTNQRRFLFVSAAAPRASLRYCKHQKECRITVRFSGASCVQFDRGQASRSGMSLDFIRPLFTFAF